MSTPGINRRVAFALAPGEARRIVRSVPFLLLLPLSVLALLMTNASDAAQSLWSQESISAALGLVPLGWCLIALTDLAILRDKRHGVDTMTATMAASDTARTGGHLLGGFIGVPFGAALLAIFYVIEEATSNPVGSPDLLELAVPLLIVAGGAVVGIAVGCWLPRALFSVPAIIATLVISGQFREWRISRTRFLGFTANETATGLPGLEVRPSALHLVWLASWIAIMAIVALARHSRGPRLVGAAVLAIAVAAAAAVGQVRPLDAETAAARADLLNQPGAHQVCDTVNGVEYCAYPDNDENIAQWQSIVAAIRSHLPATVRRPALVVSQRVPWVSGNANCGPSDTLRLIDKSISDLVVVSEAWPADGRVHPGIVSEQLPCGGRDLQGLFTGVQVGAWAVGLPPAQSGRGETCAADGQSRSVIALWLGATAGGRLDTYIADAQIGAGGRIDLRDWNDPPTWGVDWHPSDLRAALAMAGVPVVQVDQVLAEHWDELVDPVTPTTRILQLLDLPTAVSTNTDRLDTC